MAALPPFLILLDLSALMASGVKQWQEFSRLGDCFVPKSVLEEMQTRCDRAVEPSEERTAREFIRFFPESGWKTTASIAHHSALEPAEGHTLSKKARLSLDTAQAAYGLARARSDGLVVVTANDQGLIQRLRMLETPNLCGIPLTVLVQWSRTARKPTVVTNQLHAMRLLAGGMTLSSRQPTQPLQTQAPLRAQPTITTPRPVQSTTPRFRPMQAFYNLLTLAIVAIAILAVWRVVHPVSFHKLWQQVPFLGQVV